MEEAVVQRDRLPARVKALLQIEARQTTVEVHNHTACALHMYVEHRVDLQGRNAWEHPLPSYPCGDPHYQASEYMHTLHSF